MAAEDSGLAVPALGGEPGVHSARYGGRPDDRSRNEFLLERMRPLEGEARAAYYEAVVVLRSPDEAEHSFTGRVDGLVAKEPEGARRLWVDPIFFHPGLGRTFGSVSQEEKDRYSHRGQAVRELRRYLEGVL